MTGRMFSQAEKSNEWAWLEFFITSMSYVLTFPSLGTYHGETLPEKEYNLWIIYNTAGPNS